MAQHGLLVSSSHPAVHSVLPQLGKILKEYRKAEGLTQRGLAARLQIDQSYLSRIESGRRVVRDVGFLAHAARLLRLPPSQLGLSNELMRTDRHYVDACSSAGAPIEPAQDSQDDWRATRRHLNQHRHDLAKHATSLYPDDVRIGRTTLLAPAAWIASEPLRLEDIDLELETTAHRAPNITGAEPETSPTRPLRRPGQQYDRYTSAIRYLDQPTLFENRPSYRLLDVSLVGHSGQMLFGMGAYFDKLDVAEAVGHELAAYHRKTSTNATLRDLPFRSLIGDPFDPDRRALLPAVTTLTLRRKRTHGTASFLLHWRDPHHVATAAGIYDVIPAGEFQPSSVAWWDQANDFSIWRNIVREFSEELLGTPEHDGSRSAPIDYSVWPLYRTLDAARDDGKVSVYVLAVAVDALTLAATILTVAVIDDDVFDDVFRDTVDINSEGLVVSGDDSNAGNGLPFTEPMVRRFIEREPMASPGAGCLELAWRHRIRLLAT